MYRVVLVALYEAVVYKAVPVALCEALHKVVLLYEVTRSAELRLAILLQQNNCIPDRRQFDFHTSCKTSYTYLPSWASIKKQMLKPQS